ncbi:MAG TPA: hypothetical protein VK860_00560 [Ilumatobacteraceae bacterium]|nr:hypothetical protein [Ilumatobacteraceae bacterium]
MRAVTSRPPRWVRGAALAFIVGLAGALAVLLHRNGHTQGDDFALYLRQARSIFDGDIGAVVADNRFSVLNSDSAFSPIAYPWVWPLLLSPFVHLWEYDFDRLKLVGVAVFMVWLVLLHGIVRRRIGTLAALAIVAVFGTAPLYLAHTDQLLTEIPHLAVVALFVWWYDRVRTDATLLTASRAQLVALGVLVTVAFNVRREGIVLLGVIVAMQLYDLVNAEPDRPSFAAVGRRVRESWKVLATPLLAFVGSAIAFQLLLPTALLPDNGNSVEFIDDRLGEYPGILTDQLGFGEHPLVGIAILGLAAAGAVVGVRRRPTLDGPLLLLALGSSLAIGTHLRQVDRYWFQVTPWVLYFVTVALVAIAALAFRERTTIGRALAVLPLLAVVVAHLVVLPGKIGDARDFDAAGRVQSGPSNPAIAPIFDAVTEFTPPDAVIAYFRARTMTLLTDRRSFQTKNLERIAQNADYFAQRRDSTYWQPELRLGEARVAGFEEVWSDARWILWRTPTAED